MLGVASVHLKWRFKVIIFNIFMNLNFIKKIISRNAIKIHLIIVLILSQVGVVYIFHIKPIRMNSSDDSFELGTLK